MNRTNANTNQQRTPRSEEETDNGEEALTTKESDQSTKSESDINGEGTGEDSASEDNDDEGQQEITEGQTKDGQKDILRSLINHLARQEIKRDKAAARREEKTAEATAARDKTLAEAMSKPDKHWEKIVEESLTTKKATRETGIDIFMKGTINGLQTLTREQMNRINITVPYMIKAEELARNQNYAFCVKAMSRGCTTHREAAQFSTKPTTRPSRKKNGRIS